MFYFKSIKNVLLVGNKFYLLKLHAKKKNVMSINYEKKH